QRMARSCRWYQWPDSVCCNSPSNSSQGSCSAVSVAGSWCSHSVFGRQAAVTWAESRPTQSKPKMFWKARLANTEWLHHDPATLTAEQLPCELFDGELQHTLSGHWYHLHERAIRWVDGRTVRVQIAADITDRKHIDEVNQPQQKRLEQTSRLITMGEMASSLAHELNQPLSAIANYCAGCVKRMQAGNYKIDDLLAAMQKASDQAERAGKIIRRMRDMVKKGDPNRQPIGLSELVDEARAFADIEAQRTGTQIVVDLPKNLPNIVVDRIMIEQVLLNLVKNGIEAMIDVPVERRQLTLQARQVDDRLLEISVTDQGHGLAEEDVEKIFAPFYTTKAEGMGIGLAICRSIIEFHQGRLWVTPRREGGTVFHFTVPIEESTEDNDE
ncbi:MAG: GHKL domain-containing protein, partial [Rhodocyclaceae bacterium]